MTYTTGDAKGDYITDFTVSVSLDRGRTFSSSHLVDTLSSQTVNIAGGGTAISGVDQPLLVYNPVNKGIWASWRNTTPNASNYQQHWMRRFHYSSGVSGQPPAGTLIWDTNPIEIQGLSNLFFSPSLGVGMDAANLETVFLAYPDKDDLWNCDLSGGGVDTTASTQMTWFLSWTKNNGSTWNSETIAVDPNWHYCTTNYGGHGSAYNRNRPEFVFDTVNKACFVALNMSSPSGQLVKVFESIGFGHPWRQVFSKPPDSNGTHGHDQFAQAMAFEFKEGQTHGKVALHWKDTRNDPSGDNRYVTEWGAVSGDEGVTWTSGPVASGTSVPYLQNDGWGDYQGIAGSSLSNQFVGLWHDNRSGGTGFNTAIYSATLNTP